MKIIYLHQYFNTPDMQGGTRSFEMARRLVDAGHEVVMVTSWRWPTKEKSWFVCDESGIEVHWLPVPYGNEMPYRKRLGAFFRFAWRAARRAAALDGDLVFATSTPLTIAIPGVYAARRRGRPMVFEVRDLWPEMPAAIGALKNPILLWAARRLERFAYRNSSHIVALSPGMAEGVADTGYPQSRIETIPNSCDLALFDPSLTGEAFRRKHPELGDGPIVLYAGTLGFVNGVDYLADVAKAVVAKRPDIRFVILGAGIEESKVRARAEDNGVLGKNLFMYPQLPKKQVVEAFGAASVVASLFVDLPEMEKNSANKFFDGLAAGRPLVINYGGWQENLLAEHNVGLRLSRDVEAAGSALVELLAHPARLSAMGKNARNLGEARFSRDRLAECLEKLLLQSCESTKADASGSSS